MIGVLIKVATTTGLVSRVIYEIRCIVCDAKLFTSPVEWQEVNLRNALVHIKCRRCKTFRFIAPTPIAQADYQVEN